MKESTKGIWKFLFKLLGGWFLICFILVFLTDGMVSDDALSLLFFVYVGAVAFCGGGSERI